jgi:hypothetical protein
MKMQGPLELDLMAQEALKFADLTKQKILLPMDSKKLVSQSSNQQLLQKTSYAEAKYSTKIQLPPSMSLKKAGTK